MKIIFGCISAWQWFLRSPGCCSSLSLQFPAVLPWGLSSHLDPAGRRSSKQAGPGGNFRTLQKVLIKVWREIAIPSFHFFPADIFFLILLISHWMSFHSLILFPLLGSLVLSPLPFSWSWALNHTPPHFYILSSILSAYLFVHYLFFQDSGYHD